MVLNSLGASNRATKSRCHLVLHRQLESNRLYSVGPWLCVHMTSFAYAQLVLPWLDDFDTYPCVKDRTNFVRGVSG